MAPASLLFNIEVGVNQALALHVATFFRRLSSRRMQAVFVPAVLGLAVGAPLAGPLGRRIEKRTMLLIGMTRMVTCHARIVADLTARRLAPEGIAARA